MRDEIPEALLEPVVIRPRAVRSLKGVGDVLADAVNAVTRANCQFAGIDNIYRANRNLPLRDWTKFCPPQPEEPAS